MKRRIAILLILSCGAGCATAEMRREGIPSRKSVLLGETLAIFPGVLVHGMGHLYAGDGETGSDLVDKEVKSVVYPIAWPFLGAAALSSPGNASLAATFDEATSISLVSPFLFLGTWFYDLFRTPARVLEHNRTVDRMWQVKKVLDEADFPREIRLGTVDPGEKIDLSLGVRDRFPPDIELVYSLDPFTGPGDLVGRLRPSPSGEVFITLAVPPEVPAGTYRTELHYQPGDVPLTERKLPIQVRVLEPKVNLKLIGEPLILMASGTGWVRGLVEFVYETPLGGTCFLQALPLESSQEVEIHPTYDVRLSPREDWDGETLEPGETYRLEVAVYVSPDLPDGVYEGPVEIHAAPRGHPPTVVPYQVRLTVSR